MARLRRRQPNARSPRRPRDSRTIPIWDETDQGRGIWYDCWWCGFPNNDQRSTLGDESTPNGVTHDDFTVAALGAEPGIFGNTSGIPNQNTSEYRGGGSPSASLMLSGISLNDKIPITRSDSDGNPTTVLHYHEVSTRGGCSFCGSMNWKGDF